MGPRLLVAFALAFLFPPLAAATFHEAGLPDGGAQDLNARRLNVIQYHPYPDPLDSWGFPERQDNGSSMGYMEARYGAYWYPTGILDGERVLEGATEFRTTYQALEEAFQDRARIDAPARLALMGSLGPENGTIAVAVRAKQELPIANATLRVVLIEDEIDFTGSNRVAHHRFTARVLVAEIVVPLRTDADYRLDFPFTINGSWDRDHLGIVASLHHGPKESLGFQASEVLQATTYLYGQAGPTIQFTRGVLLEVLTATWCEACVFGDGAVDELANTYGIQSARALAIGHAYARPAVAWTVTLSLALGGAAGVFAYNRARKGAP